MLVQFSTNIHEYLFHEINVFTISWQKNKFICFTQFTLHSTYNASYLDNLFLSFYHLQCFTFSYNGDSSVAAQKNIQSKQQHDN